MQVKKDDTQKRILEVAKRQFQGKGFVKTSIRDIAKESGVGVSNLYNYFKSKDDIFRHIVNPLIMEMEKMVAEHHNVEYQEQFMKYAKGDGDEMISTHINSYMNLLNVHRDELELILFKAQGTSYESFIDDYTEKCTQQVVEFMDKFSMLHPNFRTVATSFTYRIHTVWMFDFIAEIIKQRLSAEEMEKAISDYIRFEYKGWIQLMNI